MLASAEFSLGVMSSTVITDSRQWESPEPDPDAFSTGTLAPTYASPPFASNASELVSSLYFASKKRKKNNSLTYSQIYGALTMNNTMCLGLFLVVMRARGLRWTFTSETITIVVATFAVGFVGARRKTLKTSLLLPVMCIYPAALGLVAFLDGVLGLQ